MAQIQVRQIERKLRELYNSKIDLSDYQNKSETDKDKVFLSRSLAAFSIMSLADIDIETSAKAVTDSFNDNGIDAIYIDKSSKILYIAQSKWDSSGDRSIELGDFDKFINGFIDLTNEKFDRFNDKIAKMESEIDDAISDSDIRIVLVITYTGNQALSTHIKPRLADTLSKFNDTSDILTYELFNQEKLIHAILKGTDGSPIDLAEVPLNNWGYLDNPFSAFYGYIDAEIIADLWKKYDTKLFDKNLRRYKGSTEVNESIKNTLLESPEHFWYFNNGITMLCNTIKKNTKYSADNKIGFFDCTSVSVINGAQTVGCIGESFKINPDNVKKAKILIRLINLENSPTGFETEITRNNNTQNKIEHKDFAALDPVQERLRKDLLLENIKYLYKSGETATEIEQSCTIEEATVALSCANPDIGITIQAKREIGKIWGNTDKPPYCLIFNSKTTGLRLWRSVQILRIVEKRLLELKISLKLHGRGRMIVNQGNRLILYKVFQTLNTNDFDNVNLDFESVKLEAIKQSNIFVPKLIKGIKANYPDSYLAVLFKNKSKCAHLSNWINELI